MSDNAGCSNALALVNFMKEHGTTWKRVVAYTPMSNGKAEQVVGTLKKVVGRLVKGTQGRWSEKYDAAVAGYRK